MKGDQIGHFMINTKRFLIDPKEVEFLSEGDRLYFRRKSGGEHIGVVGVLETQDGTVICYLKEGQADSIEKFTKLGDLYINDINSVIDPEDFESHTIITIGLYE